MICTQAYTGHGFMPVLMLFIKLAASVYLTPAEAI